MPKRVLIVTTYGSKNVLDRVEEYIRSILSRNSDSTYRKPLKDYEIQRIDEKKLKRLLSRVR